jgi:hypothetical protein
MTIEDSVGVVFLHAGSFYIRVNAVDKYINARLLSTTAIFPVCYRYEEGRERSEELGMRYSVVTVRTRKNRTIATYTGT